MKQFDLSQPNIFMRFVLVSSKEQAEQYMFLYSDTNGLKHLEKNLNKDTIFSGLLTPHQALTKMVDKVSHPFPKNDYKGIESELWVGKLVMSFADRGNNLDEVLIPWNKKLEKMMGSKNIFKVVIPAKDFDEYEESIPSKKRDECNQAIIDYIESYRLKLELEQSLTENATPNRRPKI